MYMNDMYDEHVRHELKTQNSKLKPVLLRLSLAGILEKPLMSLHVTEWRERGYGRRSWQKLTTTFSKRCAMGWECGRRWAWSQTTLIEVIFQVLKGLSYEIDFENVDEF